MFEILNYFTIVKNVFLFDLCVFGWVDFFNFY